MPFCHPRPCQNIALTLLDKSIKLVLRTIYPVQHSRDGEKFKRASHRETLISVTFFPALAIRIQHGNTDSRTVLAYFSR